jgi:hypothetical protein
VKTEEWGYEHNGFYAILILGHPSSGDGAARETDERDMISEPGGDVEPDSCLVEKVLSGLQSLRHSCGRRIQEGLIRIREKA